MTYLLDAQNLSYRRDDRKLLEDVSLHLAPGEIVGLIGPNGAGKSSLLRLLAGLEPPEAGTRQLLGRAYKEWADQRFARTLAYQEQGIQLHWPMNVERVVSLGRLPWQGFFSGTRKEDRQAVATALAHCDITALAERRADTLSAGEAALVSLARLLAGTPQLLLADEPAASLDIHHQLLLMETLRGRVVQGQTQRAALVAFHDLNLAARFCDRLVLLHEGHIVAEGPVKTVLNPDNLRRYYRIEAAIIESQHGPVLTPLRRVDGAR